ncbi:MAG TPA: VOC family protein [Thermomonospora sp.]|nr:VOC family protein [Thermomonospora sp.]
MSLFRGVRHLHLRVADAGRSAAFYERALGMTRVAAKFDDKMIILVTPGGGDMFTVSEESVPTEFEAPRERVGRIGGLDHFGVEVTGVGVFAEALDQVTGAGGELVGREIIPPGIHSAFVRDPDGYVFQVYAFAPEVKSAMP